ncbi:DUF2971 domain-containing protein [Bacteroides reticulotermitis]|uniref:DUF2971 domain-containing protein n=1 Tax=Bacteroides reticulotermitis TaxID=1133319 RepID=UPI003A887D72
MKLINKELPQEQQTLNNEVQSFIKNCTSIPKDVDIIYQYTNIDALFNGIVVKEPKKEGEEICLWASNYMYMNDPNEIKTGEKYVNEILKEYFIEDDSNKVTQDIEDSTDYYITSFSITCDSLPMWGIYGKNGAGIALGFDRSIIEKTNETLYKCTYLDKEIKDKVKGFCEKVRGEKIPQEAFTLVSMIAFIALLLNENKEQRDDIIDSIIPFLSFMTYAKDPAYKYENEVRLLIPSIPNSTIKYRTQNNLIIPYIENYFPKEALKTIIVGPTNDMKRTVKSIKRYLEYKGFKDVEVVESKISYRG